MKKTVFFILLLLASKAFSQQQIEFEWSGGKAKAVTAITNPTLPLTLVFSEDFDGKDVNIVQGKKIAALKNAKFGQGDLSKDGETGGFKIIIDENGKVNPGNQILKDAAFKLNVSQTSIKINLSALPAQPNNGGNAGAQNPNGATRTNHGQVAAQAAAYEPGYVYYDAMALAGNNLDDAAKAEILKAYGITLQNIKNNPYLDTGVSFRSGLPSGGTASILSSLGGMDVTHFAAGLARFLAERTKEELNEAFFKKMKEKLNEYPELTTLFPQTTSYLNNIEDYAYSAVEQLLKEAFETDIHNLPENLYEIKSLTNTDCNATIITNADKLAKCKARMDKIEAYFKTREGLWTGLGMFTLKEAIGSGNPAELLQSVTESDELKDLKTLVKNDAKYTDWNVASSIELANLVSQSLISKDEDEVWIDSGELGKLFKTKDALKVYLGLLIQKQIVEGNLVAFYTSGGTSITFNKFWLDAYANYTIQEPKLKSLIREVGSAFNTANNAVKKIAAASDDSVESQPQALYNYYRSFSASVKAIAHNDLLATMSGTADIAAIYDEIEKKINPAIDLAYHLSVKKYSAAIYDASIVISGLKGDDEFKPVAKSFLKYGTLISTVANAESSDEVKKAIEASVLPAGSSSIKRNTAYSISLNAYVGGFYGKAYAKTRETTLNELNQPVLVEDKRTSYTTYGLYAPIGVAFNTGSRSGWGGSVIVQMIDLGALVNFYMTKGDETALPDDFNVRLSNIFAPGAQLALNIPKTPLSILAGAQFVPALFKTQQITENAEITASNAWRIQASLVVDLPLYNLKVWDFSK